jgi:replicative DNA helicase
VVIFALEMSAVSLTDRLMLSFCDVPAYKFRSGYISRDEFYGLDSAAEQLKQLPITIDDTPVASMSQIRAKARALARTGKCRMVFIDYLQLIKMDLSYGKNVNNAVAEISREAKILAKEINVPVMLLSQLNREVERRADKRPQLSDLRDCLPVAEWVDTPSGVKQLKDKPKRIVSVDISGSRAADCVYIPKKYNSIYTVETHFGSFSATAKHRVLTATGWKYVCDLDAERDILASPKIIAHENRGYIPHGRLLGWLVGNGYLSGTPSLTLRNELMNELPEEIKSFDVEVRPKKTQKSDNVTEVYLSNGVTSGCKPNRLMQWIRELGLEGKTARHKSIPDLYLGTSNEAHLELLRGLWEADGTVSKGIARYSTVSEILARQVKWLLHTIGVRSRIGCEKKENCSDLFTVSCAVVDNANMCRICSNSKRFGWLKMPSGKYIDPAPEIFVRLAQEYGASERIQKKAGGRLKNIAKKRLSKMLENNSISTITESPFMQMQNMSWTKITSISHDEKEVRVCDLHVPETNCFLTNGMVVHNSGAIEQDADIVMFVYRPSYYGIEVAELSGSDKNSGILSVAKFREGAVGDVLFSHNEGLTQVFDYGVGLLGHQGLLGQAETQTDLPF